jgi:hypothetical protein
MDNHKDIPPVREALEQAVFATITYAQQNGYDLQSLPWFGVKIEYSRPSLQHPGSQNILDEVRPIALFEPFYQEHSQWFNQSPAMAVLHEQCQIYVSKHEVAHKRYRREEFAVGLLFAYFKHAQAFVHDKAILDRVVSAFHDLVVLGVARYELVYYVSELSAFKSFALCDGMMEIRPITEHELTLYSWRLQSMRLAQAPYELLDTTGWLCIIRADVQMSDHQDYITLTRQLDNLLVALYLTTSGSASFRLVDQREPFRGYDEGPVGLRSFRSGGGRGAIELTDAAQVATLDTVLQQVIRVSTSTGTELEALRLPVRKCRQIAERGDGDDVFLDAVIALESLLASETAGESTYRFSMRGAAILTEAFGSPSERLKLMKKIYEGRSSIVHAKRRTPKEMKAFQQTYINAQQVLKYILRWYLEWSERNAPSEMVKVVDEAMIREAHRWLHDQ